MQNTPNTNTPNTPKQTESLEKRVEIILDITNDKVTLGKIIKGLLLVAAEMPSEGGSLIKLIQDASKDHNLGLDFITKAEQEKLKAFDVGSIPPGTPPIKLSEILNLASEFDNLNGQMKGDPNDPSKPGLIAEFIDLKYRTDAVENEITSINTNPVLRGEEFSTQEQSKLSALAFLDYDPINGYTTMDHQEFERRVKLAAGTGGGSVSQVQSDYAETDSNSPAFIKNKPAIPTVDKVTIDGLGIDAATVNGYTVGENVPSGAKFTDTVYDDTQIKADLQNKAGLNENNSFKGLQTVTGGVDIIADNSHNAFLRLYAPKAGYSQIQGHQSEGGIAAWSIGQPAPGNHKLVLSNTEDIEFVVPDGSNITVKYGNNFHYIQATINGDTSKRPQEPEVGLMYFDTTLGKPIWCKDATPGKTVWVDATGTTV